MEEEMMKEEDGGMQLMLQLKAAYSLTTGVTRHCFQRCVPEINRKLEDDQRYCIANCAVNYLTTAIYWQLERSLEDGKNDRPCQSTFPMLQISRLLPTFLMIIYAVRGCLLDSDHIKAIKSSIEPHLHFLVDKLQLVTAIVDLEDRCEELIEGTSNAIARQLLTMFYEEYSADIMKNGYSKLAFSGYGDKYRTALSFMQRVRNGVTANNFGLKAQIEFWEHYCSNLRHIELAMHIFALTSRRTNPLRILGTILSQRTCLKR